MNGGRRLRRQTTRCTIGIHGGLLTRTKSIGRINLTEIAISQPVCAIPGGISFDDLSSGLANGPDNHRSTDKGGDDHKRSSTKPIVQAQQMSLYPSDLCADGIKLLKLNVQSIHSVNDFLTRLDTRRKVSL